MIPGSSSAASPYQPVAAGAGRDMQDYSPYQPSSSPSAYQATPSPGSSYVPNPSPGSYQPNPSQSYAAPSPVSQ